MEKKELVDNYFSLRRLNTDIYADTYRGGMDDFLYVPFSLREIQEKRKRYLENNQEAKIDFYVHIPFCYTLCKYCDYYKTLLRPGDKPKYLDYIYWYLEQFKEIFSGVEFRSIYIGGGTPSILLPNEIDDLLEHIFSNFKFLEAGEKTFEINPVNITEAKLDVLKKYPINRISMGIQSTDPEVLEESNRGYQKSSVVETTLNLLRTYGYTNINGDVIMGLKEDTLESIKNTVESMKEWGFSSVVLYRLLPTDEYLDEHFSGSLPKFNPEIFPKIQSYFTFFEERKDLGTFRGDVHNGYRWDLFFSEVHVEKYDDFSTKSLFGVGSSARSHIFGKIYYKFLDELLFPKDENKNVFLGRYINEGDEKDCYNVVNILHKGVLKRDEYKKEFGTDFVEDNKEIIEFLEGKGLLKISKAEVSFHLNIEDKIYYGLFFLSDSSLLDKIRFLSRETQLPRVTFIKNLELSFFFEKQGNSLQITIGNNFTLRNSNIDLFKSILGVVDVIKSNLETSILSKDILEVQKIFFRVFLKSCKKYILTVNIPYEL